jgi:hypothetical protein
VPDRSLFEEVADALRGFVSGELGSLHSSHHRYGIKVWTGSAKPPREHYEAQVVGPEQAPGAQSIAIEVGFHSEHPKEADNEAVAARLAGSEDEWRPLLGAEPVLGPFLGRAEHWRRLSEVWLDPDLDDPELVFELADRLTEYLTVLEPLRVQRSPARTSSRSTGPRSPDVEGRSSAPVRSTSSP